MSSSLQEIFISHRSAPLDADCFKQLGMLLSRSSQSESDVFFESCQPTEHHLQLLKAVAAKSTGHYGTLLNGLKEESKDVSKFCRDSKLLYSNIGSHLYDPQFLLPLLQEVSRSTRNRLIWNLGKYMPSGNNDVADTLYNSIAKIWGISSAAPLLCKCGEELITQELVSVHSLSKFQLMTLAERFPYIALTYLEERPNMRYDQYPLETVKVIVRKTIPKSFDYCFKNRNFNLFSKSTMKLILRKYNSIVLESPSKWANVLDKNVVKKNLTPEAFELFIVKQFMDFEQKSVPHELVSYFEMLPPSQISCILKEAFKNKYDCALDSNLDFWIENFEFLKLLDSSDRSNIATKLDETSKGHQWVPLMTCDKSIPKIKDNLRNEVNAHTRAELVSKLIQTCVINNDTNALEEVCKFVAVRYRNDKDVLQALFNTVPDLSLVSTETWTLMFELAYKFCSSPDWHVRSAFKFLPASIERYGKTGLKTYLEQFMTGSMNYYLNVEDLVSLKPELQVECIEQVFTEANVESLDYSVQDRLAEFLPLISKWNAKLTDPMTFPNVNAFVINRLQSDLSLTCAVDFVLDKRNGFDISFIVKCFQLAPVPKLLWFLLRSKQSVVIDDETSTKIANQAFKVRLFSRCSGYIALFKKLKKLGYVDALKCLNTQSKTIIADADRTESADAILLLALTSPNAEDYFAVIDQFLPDIDEKESQEVRKVSQEVVENEDQHEKLKQAKRKDLLYKGIGASFCQIDVPSAAIDRLLRFCVGGDLMVFARDAIYSVCSLVPNATAQEMILTLVRRPISVKKHALRLLRTVCDIETQQKLLLQLMDSEIHMTSRTVLLQSAIICLNNSKTVSMWEVTKEMMKRLTPEDESILLVLQELTVPDVFVEEYLQLILEKSKLLKKVTPEFLSGVLSIVCRKTSIVSESFVESLVREYFLSEIFFESIDSHSCVSDLLLAYLIGLKGSSALAIRQQFLEDMLNASVTETSLYNYDAKQGYYPVRTLLSGFVATFSSRWLGQSVDRGTDLRCFKDNLLSFFSQFNKNLVFLSYVHISLTAIIKQQTDDSSVSGIGTRIGDFCDSLIQTSPELSRYILPDFVGRYFQVFIDSNNSARIISILSEILPPLPVTDGSSLLRLMVVARILPTNWKTNSKYDTFREAFLPCIKNTPVETLLFKD